MCTQPRRCAILHSSRCHSWQESQRMTLHTIYIIRCVCTYLRCRGVMSLMRATKTVFIECPKVVERNAHWNNTRTANASKTEKHNTMPSAPFGISFSVASSPSTTYPIHTHVSVPHTQVLHGSCTILYKCCHKGHANVVFRLGALPQGACVTLKASSHRLRLRCIWWWCLGLVPLFDVFFYGFALGI